MKMFAFAKKQSDDRQQYAAAKHLLGRAEKRRCRMLGSPRIKRTGRPEKRSHQQDRHPDERVRISAAGKSQRGPEQDSNAEKSAGQSEPDDWLRPWRHSEQPTKQRDVNWNR